MGKFFVFGRCGYEKECGYRTLCVGFFGKGVDKIGGLWYDKYEGTPYDGYFLRQLKRFNRLSIGSVGRLFLFVVDVAQ